MQTLLTIHRSSYLAAVILLIGFPTLAEEVGPAPKLALIRLGKSADHIEVGYQRTETQFDRSKMKPVMVTVIHYQTHKKENFTFTDLAGKPIDAAVAIKRIKGETPVILLTQYEGKDKPFFNRAFLPAIKEGTMVVTLYYTDEEIEAMFGPPPLK